jgi:hypothetical protein
MIAMNMATTNTTLTVALGLIRTILSESRFPPGGCASPSVRDLDTATPASCNVGRRCVLHDDSVQLRCVLMDDDERFLSLSFNPRVRPLPWG